VRQAADQQRHTEQMHDPFLVANQVRRQDEQQRNRHVLDEIRMSPDGALELRDATVADLHLVPVTQANDTH